MRASTVTDRARVAEILQMIEDDMYADTQKMEGQPFTGAVVAAAFGELRATIAVLAEIIRIQIEESRT